MAKLIDGRTYAQLLRAALKRGIAGAKFQPNLAVVLVGDDKPSHTYVNLKKKASREAGFEFHDYLLPAAVAEGDIIQVINFLNEDQGIDGIVVQLPLPAAVDAERVTAAIDPVKDADAFHPDNVRRFLAGEPGALPPGLVEGILRLIVLPGQPLEDRHAVIVAKWPVFVETLAKLLGDRGVDVEWIKPVALNLAERVATGHIVVTAAGRAGLIKPAALRAGSTVVDVSSNYRSSGELVGDVDQAAESPADWVTPVPGGVGPMTVAMLLWRAWQLACRRRDLPVPEIPTITLPEIEAAQKIRNAKS